MSEHVPVAQGLHGRQFLIISKSKQAFHFLSKRQLHHFFAAQADTFAQLSTVAVQAKLQLRLHLNRWPGLLLFADMCRPGNAGGHKHFQTTQEPLAVIRVYSRGSVRVTILQFPEHGLPALLFKPCLQSLPYFRTYLNCMK